MKSAPNSVKKRPGDPLAAHWRRLGRPRGPRSDFGRIFLGFCPPNGGNFSTLFRFFCTWFSHHSLMSSGTQFSSILVPCWLPFWSYFLVLFCCGGFWRAKTLLGRLWGAKMVQHGAKMEPRWAMMVQHGTKMKPRWGQQASAVSLSVFALSFGGDKAKRNIYTNSRSTAPAAPY